MGAPSEARLARFTRRDAGRTIVVMISAALVAGGLTMAFDRPIRGAIQSIPLGGDIKRELEMLQQFGGVASMAIGGALIGLLQPWRFRRMLDWLLAAGIGGALFAAMKIGTGRLRPHLVEDGTTGWIGPFGSFTTRKITEAVRPIDFWHSRVYESLSMPSTHTTHAAIAAAFLMALYPRLRWLLVPWVVIVGFGRVWFDSHWPSDVVVGGILGWGLGTIVCRGSWGVRLIDWAWKTFVDKNATPALPRLEDAERAHGTNGSF